jgi:hypothetical protein
MKNIKHINELNFDLSDEIDAIGDHFRSVLFSLGHFAHNMQDEYSTYYIDDENIHLSDRYHYVPQQCDRVIFINLEYALSADNDHLFALMRDRYLAMLRENYHDDYRKAIVLEKIMNGDCNAIAKMFDAVGSK